MSQRLARLLDHARMPLYRNGYLLILNAAMTSALGIVYWIIATRYYAKPVVGLNSALIAGMMLLAGIAQLNLNSAMIRFVPRAGRATPRLVGLAYLVTILAALGAGTIFVLGSGRWFAAQSWLDPTPAFGVWFVAAVMSWCIFTIQDNVLTGLRQTHWIPLENTLFAVLKLVLLVAFARWLPTYGIFASWTLPVALTLLPINGLIFGRLIPRHIANSTDAEPIAPRQIIQFVGGNYVGSLFLLLSTTLLPVLVTQLAGASANASFYMPWMIASSLQLITANLTLSLTVEGALDQAKLREYSYRVLVQSFRLLLPSVLVIMVSAPLILHIFGATYATEGSALLRLLAIATLPNVFNVLYISLARVQRQIWGIIAVQGALCGLVLGLSMLWLPKYGIQGVGWAWLASQTLIACILAATSLRPLLLAGRQASRTSEARSLS